jgi:prepilin-type N-terminal cleavage/methylation domain-containing protein
MNRRSGFTIVELIIVIVIMAILLALAVVNLRSSQIGARDDERKTDVSNIARSLEAFYNSGTAGISGGTYPGVSHMSDLNTTGGSDDILPDIDQRSLRAPGVADTDPVSLIAATNNIETTTGIQPQPTISTYVYQALQNDGSLCTDHLVTPCRRFNIYYMLETDNTVYEITSKNQ